MYHESDSKAIIWNHCGFYRSPEQSTICCGYRQRGETIGRLAIRLNEEVVQEAVSMVCVLLPATGLVFEIPF